MLASTALETVSDRSTAGSTAERYESLIRIATSVRAQRDPEELFGILVHELGQVIQFDAIAQFDERSNKVHWHMCPGCRKPDVFLSEIDKEETLPAWVYRHQETVALPSLERRDALSAPPPICCVRPGCNRCAPFP